MKAKILPSLFSLAAGLLATEACSAAAALPSAAAVPAAAPAAAASPVLRRDYSPVSEGKSPVVTSYADVVEPVQKAVVSIYSTKTVHVPVNPWLRQMFGDQIPNQDRKEKGLGSGVIVTPNGYILTNNHVVEGADELTVALSDDRTFTAKIVGVDQKTDVAVIKIEASNLPVVTLADSEKLRVGDIVFAVGNPLNVGETVTMGIVSAKGRNQLGLLDEDAYENYIQTDAAINLGNSGGALVDAKGRLVGINSAIISPSHGNIGIGFAVPINLAASVMQSLIATGTVTRGYLGVDTQTITPEIADQLSLGRDTKGVIVSDVSAGSPADKAGLKNTDVILAVDNKPVTSTEELRLVIAEMLPGAKISLNIVRDGKPAVIRVTLGKLMEKPDELIAGVTAIRLTDEARRRLGVDARVNGLLITDVDENSPYADRLPPNMVVMEINRVPVTDLASAKALLQQGRNLLFVYYRGSPGYLVISIAEK